MRVRGHSDVLVHDMAEADGNRIRQAEELDFVGFEDREGHQAPTRLQVAR